MLEPAATEEPLEKIVVPLLCVKVPPVGFWKFY